MSFNFCRIRRTLISASLKNNLKDCLTLNLIESNEQYQGEIKTDVSRNRNLENRMTNAKSAKPSAPPQTFTLFSQELQKLCDPLPLSKSLHSWFWRSLSSSRSHEKPWMHLICSKIHLLSSFMQHASLLQHLICKDKTHNHQSIFFQDDKHRAVSRDHTQKLKFTRYYTRNTGDK